MHIILLLNCVCAHTYIVTSKPVIITKPMNATVDRIGLPITLLCEVSGDPNHYWVGWMHKNSMIQRGDGHSHSLSTSPSLSSPNSTSYHLTIHSVKVPGNYTCQVFSIEGKQLDHVTHEVSVKGMVIYNSFVDYNFSILLTESTSESSLFGTLFSQFFS